jgi:EAL domain-containing protein (putative c-di-GMP-specific phosphodiesterase class I)
MTNGHIIGVEALLRWQHAELGTLSPSEFIPIAERSGQIIKIGEWVLRTAVEQLKTWLANGLPPMTIAVNLSAIQFRHTDLLGLVSSILDTAQLAPQYLELELTESIAMDNPKKAITLMNALHASGVRMSLDDFGTGYSSLSCLKQFKVYKLKIDQSFVREISTDADDKAIVSAIIQMSHSLGFRCIAEGVETAEQFAFLKTAGCDEVQGYYFSPPLPADEFEAYVQRQQTLSSQSALYLNQGAEI